MFAVQYCSSDEHLVVVAPAITMSSRQIPATVEAPADVGPSKYPANVSVTLALLPDITAVCEIFVLNDPFGWTATDGTTNGVAVVPEGVQVTATFGTETFSTLPPPGATVNVMA